MNHNETVPSPAAMQKEFVLNCAANAEALEPSVITIHSHAGEVAISSLDNMGMAASTICLIHCLLMPFIVSILPILGCQFLTGPNAHHALAAFVFAFALFAVVPGYLKHKHILVLISMLTGLSLVLIASFASGRILPEYIELPLITTGNLILVATHWQNRKLSACGHRH